MNKLDAIVYIGRFQPFTNAHYKIVKMALETATKVIIVIGSAKRARNIRNPWTAEERRDMISSVKDFKDYDIEFILQPNSNYNFNWWLKDIQEQVSKITHKMPKLIDRFVNKAIAVLSSYKDKQEVKSYIAGIRSSYKKLAHKTELTKEQEYEIQEYFTKLLGHPVPLDWHRYFTARTGVFSKRYVPTSEYKTNIIGRLNVYPLKRAYTDKNITDIILQNIRQPKIYLKNINGFFYYNGKPVTKAEAINLCQGLGEVIIKPSLTGRGVGVRKINIINGKSQNDGKDLSAIIDEYKQDYLIEELVRQHHQMSALNPSSINTIRVLTYRSNMEVKIVYSVIRIGRKGQDIDNESAGGISTSISKEGKLGK